MAHNIIDTSATELGIDGTLTGKKGLSWFLAPHISKAIFSEAGQSALSEGCFFPDPPTKDEFQRDGIPFEHSEAIVSSIRHTLMNHAIPAEVANEGAIYKHRTMGILCFRPGLQDWLMSYLPEELYTAISIFVALRIERDRQRMRIEPDRERASAPGPGAAGAAAGPAATAAAGAGTVPSISGPAADAAAVIPTAPFTAPTAAHRCGSPGPALTRGPPADTGQRPFAPASALPARPSAPVPGDLSAAAQTPAFGGLARMLTDGPWPTDSKFATPTDLIDADLEAFFVSVVFEDKLDEPNLKELARNLLDTMPQTRDSSVYSRKVQETLVPGAMIDTTVNVWMLERFADLCGFTLRTAACLDKECPLFMDREAARNKIVFDVELFNETVRDRNVALTMASKGDAEKSRLGSKAGNGKGTLEHRIRRCKQDLESGAQLCFIQLTALHASAAVLDTRQCGAAGDLREAVCTRLCSLGWPRKDDEQYLVDSLVTLLGMGVSWKDTPQVFQIVSSNDCVLRSTFAQIEFKLGTVNGISSPNAGQQAVHDQMQRARIWCMLRVAKEAHELYPKEYDPLQTRIRDAIKKPRMSTSPQLSSRPAAPASSDLCPSVPPCNAASTRSTPQQVNSDQISSPSFWNLVPLIASCELPCISLHKAWMGEKRLIIRAHRHLQQQNGQDPTRGRVAQMCLIPPVLRQIKAAGLAFNQLNQLLRLTSIPAKSTKRP